MTVPPPSPHNRLTAGLTIADGRYRLERKLQTGGNGVVWLATQLAMGAPVVMKFALRRVGGSNDADEQLLREAQVLVALSHRHPHVVKILDLGNADGATFVVMQFMANGSLHEFCAGRSRSDARLVGELTWLRQTASALDFMHRARAVHCDVKPANILLDDSFSAHLADFGIVSGDGANARDIVLDAARGVVVGSLPYLAPESLIGAPPTPRADQFSLAVTLYEFAFGRLPFAGASAEKLRESQYAVFNQWHAAAALGGLSEASSRVLRRALSIDPDLRYRSCSEFATEFVSGWRGLPPQTPRRLPRPSPKPEPALSDQPTARESTCEPTKIDSPLTEALATQPLPALPSKLKLARFLKD